VCDTINPRKHTLRRLVSRSLELIDRCEQAEDLFAEPQKFGESFLQRNLHFLNIGKAIIQARVRRAQRLATTRSRHRSAPHRQGQPSRL